MRFQEVGALPVFEHGIMHGIITERDVVSAVAEGVNPATAIVQQYMTEDPVTVPPTRSSRRPRGPCSSWGPGTSRGRGREVVGMISARDVLVDEALSEEGAR